MSHFDDRELKRLFEDWLDSDVKMQVLAFYDANPNTLETWEGLAVRLGVTEERLRAEMQQHVQLGLFKERTAGSTSVIVFDRARQRELQEHVAREIDDRIGRGDSGV